VTVRLGRIPGARQLPGLLGRRRDDLVVFDSWHGAYSDNPRAIADALHEHRPGLRHVWVATEQAEASLPPWATPVRPGSREYLAAFGTARYVVASTHMPRYLRKAAGTTYVQTWHGTPLKRLGFDIDRPRMGEAYLKSLRVDVPKWDVLLSPNPFSTPIFRRAFAYGGRVVEAGYPRNDALADRAAGDAVRAATRRELGIPDGTLAVLYAPTWRDNQRFTLELDPAALRGRVRRDHVLLVRTHPIVTPPDLGELAIDVSRHGDIRDLYLAADVLVTDYSSAMFDFAVTGKPMLFYTYDLAEYRDELRGFYFDFEREAPGPLLTTTEEVAEALDGLDAVVAAHADRYAAFAARFAPLDDGRAAERVVEAVF
jgi:CDP-glycerol glycerophosphotransferase